MTLSEPNLSGYYCADLEVLIDAGLSCVFKRSENDDASRELIFNYQYVSSPIHTYCIGQACSMGSLLLAAGTSLTIPIIGNKV